MARALSEVAKLDVGLAAQSSLNGAATGAYYLMADYRRAVAVLHVGAMAAGKTAKIEVLQAIDAAGTSAATIPPAPAAAEAEATITANTKVTAAKVTCAAVQAADKITVNGVEMTAAAAADHTSNEFKADGTDNTETATGLAAAIKACVPGITASANQAVVTIESAVPGEELITITDAAATMTPATLSAQATVEVDVSKLAHKDGYGYVATRVTTTAAMPVAVTLLRGDARYSPVQQVAKGVLV